MEKGSKALLTFTPKLSFYRLARTKRSSRLLCVADGTGDKLDRAFYNSCFLGDGFLNNLYTVPTIYK